MAYAMGCKICTLIIYNYVKLIDTLPMAIDDN